MELIIIAILVLALILVLVKNIRIVQQAKAVVVDTGVCKGMTMGEVAEKRPLSLKFYIFGGYRGDNNILKAAAKVVYEQLQNAA